MKLSFLLLALVSISMAEDLDIGFLYVDSVVNKDLHALVYPVPEKFPALKAVVISNAELDSLARNEMGKVTVLQVSGKSVSGKYLTVGDEGVAFGQNLIRFQDIDYLEYKERQSIGGFLGTTFLAGLFSAVFFGGLEGINWVSRGEYDYKRVLIYSGAIAGMTAVFYFPSNTGTRVGFRFKD